MHAQKRCANEVYTYESVDFIEICSKPGLFAKWYGAYLVGFYHNKPSMIIIVLLPPRKLVK